jgi:hypothetical protein
MPQHERIHPYEKNGNQIGVGKFEPMDKLIWVIVINFVPIVGSILYFIIGTRQRLA